MTELQAIKRLFTQNDPNVELWSDIFGPNDDKFIEKNLFRQIKESGARDYLIKNYCGKYCNNYIECSLEFFKSLRIFKIARLRETSHISMPSKCAAYFIRCWRRRHIHKLGFVNIGDISPEIIPAIMEMCPRCDALPSCFKSKFDSIKIIANNIHRTQWHNHPQGIDKPDVNLSLSLICMRRGKRYGTADAAKGGQVARCVNTVST